MGKLKFNEFYDVKAKGNVTADIKQVHVFKNGDRVRYAFKAESDGRSLTKFVSVADAEKAKAQGIKWVNK